MGKLRLVHAAAKVGTKRGFNAYDMTRAVMRQYAHG